MDFDWKGLVRTVAPGIASVFGTPLAGVGVKYLVDALLPADAARPADAEQFLQQTLATANPEMLLKIKQAEQSFAVEMRKLDIDLEKISSEDRDSARRREVATGDWTPRILATVIVGGFFMAQYMVFEEAIPAGSEMLIARVLGTLDAALMLVLYYYYGGSASSARKTEILAKQAGGGKP